VKENNKYIAVNDNQSKRNKNNSIASNKTTTQF
jgi:hypothetical protein